MPYIQSIVLFYGLCDQEDMIWYIYMIIINSYRLSYNHLVNEVQWLYSIERQLIHTESIFIYHHLLQQYFCCWRYLTAFYVDKGWPANDRREHENWSPRRRLHFDYQHCELHKCWQLYLFHQEQCWKPLQNTAFGC